MIIGLCGAAGAGKDTAASRLVSAHGFVRHSFAAPLYEAVSAVTGLSVAELQDRSRKEVPIEWIGQSPRALLQSLGTDWGRNMVGENLWVDAAIRRISGDTVITDVRFDNEAQAVLDRGGAVWQIVGRSVAVRSHASEAGVSSRYVTDTIHNTGTLQDLEDAVDAAFQRLLRYTMG